MNRPSDPRIPPPEACVCEAAAGEETARLALEAGGEARFVQADVTKSGDVRRYVQAALDAYGAIDCFFNNAGIEGEMRPTAEYDEAVFDAVMGVNVKGVFLGLRHVLPAMIRQGRGAVVNTASIAGKHGQAWLSVYSATKAAVIAFSASMHRELSAEGVKSTALCPAWVNTPMTDFVKQQVPPEAMIQTSDIVASVRMLLSLSPGCVVPEIVFQSPAGRALL